MITLSTKNCTRVLDSVIAAERVRYAQERVDFHDYFAKETVFGVQRVLADRSVDVAARAHRNHVTTRILEAQQKSPHALWTLLLVQAFEAELVKRAAEHGNRKDALVVESFQIALENLPTLLSSHDLPAYVLLASRLVFDHVAAGGDRKRISALKDEAALTIEQAAVKEQIQDEIRAHRRSR